MKNFKSYFLFTNKQRSGVFLLIIIIVVFQFTYFKLSSKNSNQSIENDQIESFIREVDSLKQLKLVEQEPKIYPFNPNYITDYKGYSLGMSIQEIDRLHAFRAKEQWVNSTKQFQEVTNISDSLLNVISPYFKFPDWVTNPSVSNKNKNTTTTNYNNNNHSKTFAQKIDLNQATAQQLQKVYGIGEKLSQRIIDFRNKQPNGFIADIQLSEVYGLAPEVIENITNQFTVKNPPNIQKLNLNMASVEELVTIKYIDYEIAYEIIETRILHDGFKSLDELTKVKDFPVHKLEIIKLYLTL